MMRLAGHCRAVLAGRVALLLALSVPWTAQAGLFSDDEARKATADLRAEVFQRRVEEDAHFTRVEASIDELKSTTQKLQESIDRLDQAIRNLGLAALSSQVDGLGQDLARLRGQVEVQGNQIDQAQKRSKEFYLDIDTRVHNLEQAGKPPGDSGAADPNAGGDGKPALAGISPPVAVGAGAGRAPGNVAGIPPSAAETQAYESAYKVFKAGNFPVAIRAFQQFNKAYPNSSYAPNALFWIGMAQYRIKAYGPAGVSLKAVAANFPDSSKASDALLNLAMVQLEQGDTAGAHDTLEDVLNRYPGSDAASKAKAKLGRK